MKVVFFIALALLTSLCGCQQKNQSDDSLTAVNASNGAMDAAKDELPIVGRPPVQEKGNLLLNAGFEQGLDGWKWLDWSKGWAPFALSTNHAYEGGKALHLPVLSTDARQTVVWGGVQEIVLPDDIPECIEGYYYVENWHKEDWRQYLQLVVIDLSHPLGEKQGQAQLRYIISGSSVPPLSISNAQYLFVEKERRETPILGKWTHFSVNPREDFVKSWNYTPSKGSSLRVLFEGRFDYHKSARAARADVYFDNLYFGPKTSTRCSH